MGCAVSPEGYLGLWCNVTSGCPRARSIWCTIWPRCALRSLLITNVSACSGIMVCTVSGCLRARSRPSRGSAPRARCWSAPSAGVCWRCATSRCAPASPLRACACRRTSRASQVRRLYRSMAELGRGFNDILVLWERPLEHTFRRRVLPLHHITLHTGKPATSVCCCLSSCVSPVHLQSIDTACTHSTEACKPGNLRPDVSERKSDAPLLRCPCIKRYSEQLYLYPCWMARLGTARQESAGSGSCQWTCAGDVSSC